MSLIDTPNGKHVVHDGQCFMTQVQADWLIEKIQNIKTDIKFMQKELEDTCNKLKDGEAKGHGPCYYYQQMVEAEI